MARAAAFPSVKSLTVFACVTASLLLGACASDGDALQTSLLDGKPKPQAEDVAQAEQASAVPKTELEKATEYWGKKFKEHPNNLEAAISYAKNLKAMGERQQALAVIQQAASVHGSDKKLASEYGRLALELDQISVAKQMLAIADDPASPDWRVISARGTISAKEGKYAEAIPLYERALMLSQEQTSVMNNLAMAYAMAGEAGKAEDILRRIEAKGGNAKSRQNLALVLGLQGKFDESKTVASQEMSATSAAADNDVLRRMVKMDKPAAAVPVSKASAKAGAAFKPAAQDAAWRDEMTVSTVTSAAPGQPPLKGMSP
ncbi:MAG: tetratricopeptide repeat protein [Hyphomicrobiaceae bacterium]